MCTPTYNKSSVDARLPSGSYIIGYVWWKQNWYLAEHDQNLIMRKSHNIWAQVNQWFVCKCVKTVRQIRGQVVWIQRSVTKNLFDQRRVIMKSNSFAWFSCFSKWLTVSPNSSFDISSADNKTYASYFIFYHWHQSGTHFITPSPRQIVANLLTTFQKHFHDRKMFEFQLIFHWSLFERVQLTISHQWIK